MSFLFAHKTLNHETHICQGGKGSFKLSLPHWTLAGSVCPTVTAVLLSGRDQALTPLRVHDEFKMEKPLKFLSDVFNMYCTSFFRGSILKCIMSKFWLSRESLSWAVEWFGYWWYKFFCAAVMMSSYEKLMENRRLGWCFSVLTCLRMDWDGQAVLQKLGEIQRRRVRKTKGKTLSWRDAHSVCVKEKAGSRVSLKSAWIRKSSQSPVYKNILRSVQVKLRERQLYHREECSSTGTASLSRHWTGWAFWCLLALLRSSLYDKHKAQKLGFF